MSVNNTTGAKCAVSDLLSHIEHLTGAQFSDEVLKNTPGRFVNLLLEYCWGYTQNPESVLEKQFRPYGDSLLVSLERISFNSLCEHHLSPVRGDVFISYVPDSSIAGISKFARLVDIYSRRLQLQERLNWQIADTIDRCLKPKGVDVRITAYHTCLSGRGAKKEGSRMETRVTLGCLKK